MYAGKNSATFILCRTAEEEKDGRICGIIRLVVANITILTLILRKQTVKLCKISLANIHSIEYNIINFVIQGVSKWTIKRLTCR